MKSLAIVEAGKIEIIDKDKPTPQGQQVLVKIKAAALNKRDQFIRQGKYPGIQFGSTLGSDAVGVVEEVADNDFNGLLGKRVVINPNLNWGDNPKVQGRDYTILGMPQDGTFSEYVIVDYDRLHEVPKHLSDAEAAALPLAGLTAYRACFYHGNINAGDDILISGFGGGVAQYACQFAIAAGANVYVTTSSDSKLSKAVELGAQGGFNYRDADWTKNASKTTKGFDAIIDSAGGNQFNDFIRILKPGGRVVFYGATKGLPNSLDLYRMFWSQVSIHGSTMGNDQEFAEMIQLIDEHKIRPMIDSVRPFDDIITAFDDIAEGSKLGKLVIQF